MVHPRTTTAAPLAADVSIAAAKWLGVGAFLIDVLFGYGPTCAGFWLAMFALNADAQEFAVIVDRGSELLAAVVGYLIVTRLLGRPLEVALALGLFVLGWHALETLGPEPDSGSVLVVSSIWTLGLFIGPWVLGFRQVWEGNGQTLGRSLFGLQVDDRDGRPAGFLRLLLRDGVLRPLTWLGAYAAFGLVLMLAFWLVLPVVVLLGGK